jgi:hypothetical protein
MVGSIIKIKPPYPEGKGHYVWNVGQEAARKLWSRDICNLIVKTSESWILQPMSSLHDIFRIRDIILRTNGVALTELPEWLQDISYHDSEYDDGKGGGHNVMHLYLKFLLAFSRDSNQEATIPLPCAVEVISQFRFLPTACSVTSRSGIAEL